MYIFLNTYGFKSSKAPSQMDHLNAFENDVYNLVSNVEFNHRRNDFQRKLSKDVKEIRRSQNALVAADKTTNLYSMNKEHYGKLVKDNVTKSYKKACDTIKHDIDREGSVIITDLKLADRMEVIAEKKPFVTLKDHNPDFTNKPCRLISPAKSEVGIISQQILKKVNDTVPGASGLQQWKSTYSVRDWFNGLSDRTNLKFLKFDIVEFYPSIMEKLFSNALKYAKGPINISKDHEAIIWYSRKSLLSNDKSTGVKKQGGDFDVTMGSFDGAEVCELVGLYLLSLLCENSNKDQIGLYRDDGLAALKLSGPQASRARKDLCDIFRSCGLRVTVDILMTQTDFLDVTFDLSSGKYWPYRKPNDEPLYIHAKSSHPPSVLKKTCHLWSATDCPLYHAIKNSSTKLNQHTGMRSTSLVSAAAYRMMHPKGRPNRKRPGSAGSYGLTHHLTKVYPPTLPNDSSAWSIDISQSITATTTSSTGTLSKWVTAACQTWQPS